MTEEHQKELRIHNIVCRTTLIIVSVCLISSAIQNYNLENRIKIYHKQLMECELKEWSK